jgi:hypothetical protein
MKLGLNLQRMGLVLHYLSKGGELRHNGQVWVWLDNHVTKETETHQYVIDGLAVQMTKYVFAKDSTGFVGEPFYVGQDDMTLKAFIKMIDSIDQEEIDRIRKELYKA